MSRPKSARGSSPASAKAAKSSAKPKAAKPRTASAAGGAKGARGVYVQAPRSDIYVTLLGISLAAMLLACLFLFLVWSKYDMKMKPTAALALAGTSLRA